MKKPSVNVNPVANKYSAPDERIVEFTFDNGVGGLISFRTVNGTPTVEIYRCDMSVIVSTPINKGA